MQELCCAKHHWSRSPMGNRKCAESTRWQLWISLDAKVQQQCGWEMPEIRRRGTPCSYHSRTDTSSSFRTYLAGPIWKLRCSIGTCWIQGLIPPWLIYIALSFYSVSMFFFVFLFLFFSLNFLLFLSRELFTLLSFRLLVPISLRCETALMERKFCPGTVWRSNWFF